MHETMSEMGADINDQNEVLNLLETLRTEVIGSRPPSLMDKMGGDSILSKLVHAFFDKIEDHLTLASFFRKSNMGQVRKHFIDFLATVIGGMYNRYKGKSIKDIHWKLNISDV